MEHKTEVDLPFTVGSTATSSPIFLADTERDTHKYARKQVLGNRTFSMNSKRTLYFYFFIFFGSNQQQSAPYFTGEEEEKKRLFPWRWTTDCFAGGKIAVIEMVMSSLYLITFSLRCILRVAI